MDSKKQPTASDQQTIEYQMDKDQYAVVIVQTQEMSDEEAKKFALQKAAEKTRSQNLRYFTIESEGKVQAMRSSSTADDNSPSPRNMYYELIQSGNFGRDRFEDERVPQENVYSGYRIVFKCYSEKPNSEAVDVCDIVSCKEG
ncbi:MAG: hypothetical protein KF898_06080 [Parachlamydiales bacterium]|nr:hypothetical protein [Verrucomicrobiota bacterium]MBX3719198.1 hypothetical protein [Candidatus Acheromyda pituitae]